jgi:hypothetical protein
MSLDAAGSTSAPAREDPAAVRDGFKMEAHPGRPRQAPRKPIPEGIDQLAEAA